jgi:hypothetical protein
MRLRYASPRRVSVYARVRSVNMALSVIWFARRANDDQAAYWIEHAEQSARLKRPRSNNELSMHRQRKALDSRTIQRVRACREAGIRTKDIAGRFSLSLRKVQDIISGRWRD